MIKLYKTEKEIPRDIWNFGENADGSQVNAYGDPMHFAWDDWDYVIVPGNNEESIEACEELARCLAIYCFKRYDFGDTGDELVTFFVCYHS